MYGTTRYALNEEALHRIANGTPAAGVTDDEASPTGAPCKDHGESEIPDSHWTRTYVHDYSPEDWTENVD